jgi:peptidoglycan/xylan/chitin deacetylase (PgdA/CDA1 family)
MNINLCFHGIGRCLSEREPGEAGYWIAEDLFLRVLDEVADRPDVRLSFDDGNRSDLEIAFPALRERGMGAIFFALAGRLDDAASLHPEDLRELRSNGMEIGNHGWAHVPWRSLSSADAHREFVEAREALREASDGRIDDAAMPLGRYDRTTIAGLHAANYRTVYSSDRFRARDRSWMQARFSLTAADTLDSVRAVLDRRIRAAELRNLAASVVKRRR